MRMWEIEESREINLPSYYYESNFIEYNNKTRKTYRNFINNRRGRFIVDFVIYDYYTNACLMKDSIVIRVRNVNSLSKNKLEYLIQKRYYPMKFGNIKILGVRRG